MTKHSHNSSCTILPRIPFTFLNIRKFLSFFYQCMDLGTLSIWFISRRVWSKNNNPVHIPAPFSRSATSSYSYVYVYGYVILCMCTFALKVLTNEKRGGLTVVSFDRSDFKLFTLKFPNKSVQSSSCERHKTAQRTLFLLFAINNCFPTSDDIGGVICISQIFLHHRRFK